MEDLERHYRFHLRRMAVGLASSLAMGVAMIFALIRPGIQLGILLGPALIFIIASVGLNIAVRGWEWPRPTTDYRYIGRDEWVQANVNRSRRIALLSIYAAQVPLMFLVAYIPDVPTVAASVVGMAILTMASGSTAFFASYLFHIRQHTGIGQRDRGWPHDSLHPLGPEVGPGARCFSRRTLPTFRTQVGAESPWPGIALILPII